MSENVEDWESVADSITDTADDSTGQGEKQFKAVALRRAVFRMS
jgi:hypothetical protein